MSKRTTMAPPFTRVHKLFRIRTVVNAVSEGKRITQKNLDGKTFIKPFLGQMQRHNLNTIVLTNENYLTKISENIETKNKFLEIIKNPKEYDYNEKILN